MIVVFVQTKVSFNVIVGISEQRDQLVPQLVRDRNPCAPLAYMDLAVEWERQMLRVLRKNQATKTVELHQWALDRMRWSILGLPCRESRYALPEYIQDTPTALFFPTLWRSKFNPCTFI